MLIFETFSAPCSLAGEILEPPAGPAIRFQHLSELVKAGKARLVNLTGVATKPGNHYSMKSADEFRYPTEFNPAEHANEFATGTAFETRDLGDSLEHELTLQADDSSPCLNYVLRHEILLGMRDIAEPPQDPAIDQPTFGSRSITGNFRLLPGNPRLTNTLSSHGQKPPGAAESADVWYTFVRYQPIPAPQSGGTKALGKGSVIEYSFVSMNRGAAETILSSVDGSDSAWQATQQLVAENKARLDHVMVIPVDPDSSAKSSEYAEFRYGTEFVAPGESKPPVDSRTEMTRTEDHPVQGSNNDNRVTIKETSEHYVPGGKTERTPGYPAAFETRDQGYTVEQELKLNPTQTAGDLTVWINWVGNRGTVQYPGTSNPHIAQPLFEHRSQGASIPVLPGIHFFVGTLNPPGENGVNGRKDDGTVCLSFAKLSTELP